MSRAPILATVAVVALAAVIALAVAASPASKPLDARIGPAPVVVELFTSQGCSSCPPADAILAAYARNDRLRGKVIPLAFHVDYWDRLGWRDPFSSRSWTQRQMAYVSAMHLSSAYTPQAVIGGAREMVGSNEGAIAAAVEEASKRTPAGTLRLSLARKTGAIDVTLHGDVGRDGQEAIVTLFEDDVTTNIAAGENSGRSLVNDAIVRQLVRAAAPRGTIDKTFTIRVDPTWRTDHLGIAAFLQDRNTLAIGGATVAR